MSKFENISEVGIRSKAIEVGISPKTYEVGIRSKAIVVGISRNKSENLRSRSKFENISEVGIRSKAIEVGIRSKAIVGICSKGLQYYLIPINME